MTEQRRRGRRGSFRQDPQGADEREVDERQVDERKTGEREAGDEPPTLELADEDGGDARGREGDDGPVRVSCAAADEAHFDVVVEVVVPAMDKPAVLQAVAAPLRDTLRRAAARLRHRRVLVRFAGAALIGSAVKDLAAGLLADARVVLGVVRRGYGDETVHRGELPRARVAVRSEGGTVHVAVDGDVPAGDLAAALEPELTRLGGDATGKSFVFAVGGAFAAGGAEAAAVRDLIRGTLAAAGAQRVAVGDDLLFDRDLESRVRVVPRGGRGEDLEIGIADAADAPRTLEALELVLRGQGLAGTRVRVRMAGGAAAPGGDSPVLRRLVELCVAGEARQVALDRGAAETEILWPPLLAVTVAGDETVLQVRPEGRSRAAVLAQFPRECAALGDRIAGAAVVVDWPAGFALDGEAEESCLAALGALAPRSVACTIGGADREPFLPAPVTVTEDGDGGQTLRIDTDAGKPAELLRAIGRRVGRSTAGLQGRAARIEIRGAVAASRSVLRSLRELVENAGAARVELDDHGVVDVLVPPLLQVVCEGGSARIAAQAAGRDEAQIALALPRELDAAALPEGLEVAIAPSPLAGPLAAALVDRGAARVVLDGPVPLQLHPPLFAAPERETGRLVLRARPALGPAEVAAQVQRELPGLLGQPGDLAEVEVVLHWPGAGDHRAGPVAKAVQTIAAAKPLRLSLDDGRHHPVQLHPEVVREYVRLLGRSDAVSPPITMFALDVGRGIEHQELVRDKLAARPELLDGRRVLLTLRDGERELPVRDGDALIAAARPVVDARAAATLVFRGTDASGRRFFEVVHSADPAIPVGRRFGDPRAAASG